MVTPHYFNSRAVGICHFKQCNLKFLNLLAVKLSLENN